MRRRFPLAVLSLVLAAAACGGSEPDGALKVSGGFGGRPAIAFPAGGPPAELKVQELVSGKGRVVGRDDLVVAQYTAHVWDGKDNRLLDSSFGRGAPGAFSLDGLIPGLGRALSGHRAGSRVLAVIPPKDGFGPNPPDGMTSRDGLVYVVDVLGAFPPGAAARGRGGSGELAGVRIAVGTGGRPAVTLPATPPPRALATKVLVRGDGPKVRPGRLLVTQYEGRLWRSGKVVDSSWAAGRPKAFRIGDGSVIAGWNRGLVGVPVGSRVAMVVPPGDGYGPRGVPGKIKGTDTLVFVVDVLGAF
ncbi:hypothetical protein GCM10022226_42960 [Sphaerisporangium flaviroseum]|uniref:Peptidyl-prolyl cis-trans isomerase n=1 Tax=Sphaerisporangium flaviroseum TaxID=509199 RepID=A0ABP7IGL6_9ACTN